MEPTRHDPDWQPTVMAAEDLFFRDDDRARMDQAVHTLSEEKHSVTLACDNDEVLAHYGRLLVRRLRQTPQIKVEVYYPSNTEALLQRFNDALAPISVDQARRGDGPSVPASVWVLHDAKLARSDELQLLLRLVHDFPGANVRLVLLLGGEAAQHPETGRRMMRWPVTPPTDAEADAMRQVGRLMGFEPDVQALLQRLGSPEPVAMSPAQEAIAADPHMAPTPEITAQPPVVTRSSGRLVAWVLALLVLASALALMWYPQERQALVAWVTSQITGAETESGPVAQDEKALPAELTAAPAAVSEPAGAAPPPPATPPVTPPVLQPVPPEPAPQAATAAPLAVAAPSVPAPAVDTQERVVAPAPPAPAWDANLAAARDWVRRMPRGVWLVQHASLDEWDAAKTWLQQHPQLRRARVVAALKGNGQRHYVVVSGPFNGFDRAKAYAAGPGMPSEPWLRGAASLKTVLADEKD
ncbi:MAG: hypothetical protein O2836_01255 [Proteobacteria bacterium]|nr:hypothetical protein [Pseudomonadota bacterium]